MATVRFVTPSGVSVGLAPIEAKNRPIGESATLGLPNRFEIHPRMIGELMSPNRWIRKMKEAYPVARRFAGTTLAVTVLHGPSTIDNRTDAPNRNASDDLVIGVEDAEDAEGRGSHHGQRGEQEIGPTGDLAEEVGQEHPQDDPDQAGADQQEADRSVPASLADRWCTR